MVKIDWCLNTKKGIEIVEPNNNMSDSYIKMAEESLKIINKVKEESNIWTASTVYYTIYYCLYSVMIKLGIKCEIHSCSIEFMNQFLLDFYSQEDVELIKSAFDMRQDMQYYPDRLTDIKGLNLITDKVSDFLIKTKEIIIKLNEEDVQEIRTSVQKINRNN